MILELAEYEKAPNEVILSLDQFKDDLDQKRFDAFVCLVDDKLVGMALYYPIYSTWKGHSIHLEDLIVAQDHRRLGLGTLLFNAVVEEAKTQRVGRLQWQVLDWNQSAIDFYKKYPAEFDGEWYNVKISNKDLALL